MEHDEALQVLLISQHQISINKLVMHIENAKKKSEFLDTSHRAC